MTLISTHDLAKSFGAKDIFKDVSLGIPQRARIAIVGPNGIGKSTLLRILIGIEEPSKGVIHKARHLKIGYLPQEAVLPGNHTLWEECLGALTTLLEKEAELHRMEQVMSEPGQNDDLIEVYGKLQESFERLGGYTYETRIRQTLTGLGFAETDYQRPIQQLSGGQRTRAYLARLLLALPDLLILDEPTNHLDIQAVEWLEGALSQWEGAVLIVSHDRYFLDRVINQIWEMNRNGLEVYRGNYSAYLNQRQERWELRQKLFETEKERLEKELDYIQRNIAGQNTLQAKGRLKRLGRYLDAIDKAGLQAIQGKKWAEISDESGATSQSMNLEEAIHRVHALQNPQVRPLKLGFSLKPEARSGDLVLQTRDLAIGYEDEGQALFNVPDLVLKRKECAALIGPNGAGKTTFLKTLLGKLPPFSGEIQLGASLDVAYFAQAHEDLNPDNSLIEEIESVEPKMLPAEIRNYLARYLFSGDDVFKPVAVLSGGERGRLALAKLCLSKANLLLLDEPTNHLDIPSQEVLQDILSVYSGTILLVSHDRYLIDALSSQIWEIDPDQTNLCVFLGTYSEYKAMREAEKASVIPKVQVKATPGSSKKRSTNIDRRQRTHLEELEKQISTLEEEIAEISSQLENPPSDSQKVQLLGKQYVDLQDQISKLLAQWEEAHRKLEEA